MSKRSIDLQSVLDEGKFGALRIFVFVVCFLSLVPDGYDVQALGAIAPTVMRDLKLSPKKLGLVFSLGGAGMLIGAITFGTLGDMHGRKVLLCVCLAIFGGFSVCLATATSGTELTIYKVLFSTGLGGAVPNVTALASEYPLMRMRASSVTI
jgi:MFS family permease